MMPPSFSSRQGFEPEEPEANLFDQVTYRFRQQVVVTALNAELSPLELRKVVCRRLRQAPNHDNDRHASRIKTEIKSHLRSCPWNRVFDIIEDVVSTPKLRARLDLGVTFAQLRGESGESNRTYFHRTINKLLREEGIGWKLSDGKLTIRGNEAFERVAREAPNALERAGMLNSAQHLQEAIADLSRRPDPDLAGAVYHSIGAVEGTLRRVCGDSKPSLAQLLRKEEYRKVVPAPLNVALDKMWGYSSEYARHVKEGNAPDLKEAKLVVHAAAAVSEYLSAIGSIAGQEEGAIQSRG